MNQLSTIEPVADPAERAAGDVPFEHVPVLIVGAGLSGLSTATFLGVHGAPALVIERHPSTSTAPKARGQMPTVMEALKIADIDDAVREAGFDLHEPMEIVIGRTVAGEPLQTLLQSFDFDLSAITAAGMGMAGQERTEAILARRATELGAEIRFNTELVSVDLRDDGVLAVLRDVVTGSQRRVFADYVVASDGWRTGLRDVAGIGVHGHGSVSQWMSLVFRADLGDVFDREFGLVYLQNPELHGGAGVFGTTDDAGRYIFSFGFDAATEGPDDFDHDFCVEQIRIGMGMPELDVRLDDVAETEFAHRLADRYSAGRILLVGDAAHVMPPTGGQGGNTAVLDGFSLGWKLAAVVNGQAGPGLLDSHDLERRPYGEMIADWQYQNLLHRMTPGGAEKHGAGEHGADRRSDDDHGDVDHDRGEQDGAGDNNEIGMMFGYRVVGGAVCLEPDDDHQQFENGFLPTGRPGSRVPQLWLTNDGVRTSIIDRLGRSFVIITASVDWREAAAHATAELGLPIEVVVVDDRQLDDHETSWTDRYGIGENGATLIRPDLFVGWRTAAPASPASTEELIKALSTVLSR
ncbi:hypothetical protein FOE78_11850 [Microlunatus elymi]|uniref:FAD-binding domain-containing protein n=1 Tax=Microlunatus elymi TaxID=2596828 RepID=A0A516PZA0_9ACTN|nr:FAD-dependent monooxygenase [Microlunatus elymi]QDP96505.1 hypothetical protein FOE78_11850 [Microlunatus elymi]